MTVQIKDTIRIDDATWCVARWEPNERSTPRGGPQPTSEELGIVTQSMGSCLWRGRTDSFALIESRLILLETEYSPADGSEPVGEFVRKFFETQDVYVIRYKPPKLIDFTGVLRVEYWHGPRTVEEEAALRRWTSEEPENLRRGIVSIETTHRAVTFLHGAMIGFEDTTTTTEEFYG